MVTTLKPRRPLPSVGELVVGTVEEVYDFGAYLSLDEYDGMRAFLPWSEVATRAVRKIDRVVQPGRKVVVKVIRVYKARKQVDVSLKRVMEGERRRKMIDYKRRLKAASIIELVAKDMGKTLDEAYKEVIWKLEDAYGDPMSGLERAVIYGREALEEAEIPEEWIEPLLEAAKTHIKIKQVKISGIFTLRSFASDGVERIKKVLVKARENAVVEGEEIKVRVYTIGAPRYRIDLQSHDYKILEKALQKSLKVAEKEASKLGIEYSFERLKE
ncbi:MAG: translation initiation factor IF-2 subunit alpha [Desulfurococcales archaeon]|nr:translation initiation factor IF-2 subunit alpha [Desulfurococcales archaeon]MCE4622842.1 translation initiation factor IF-2 subunit alpha [Desulfurococcales archaeon]MCE4627031.1 translation initiation factor IF-2 subunit alpha [Desulfurococcales archaeon]MCE4628924.1 translation initiation factor IF-2 subunit alpha [Desulfurococcales archaeon]